MTNTANIPKTLSGKSLASTITTMAALGSIGKEVLDAYGIHEVDPEAWYPINVRKEIHQIALDRFGEEALFSFGLNNRDYYKKEHIAFRKFAEDYEWSVKEEGEKSHPESLHKLLNNIAFVHAEAIRGTAANSIVNLDVYAVFLTRNVFEYHVKSRAEPSHEAFLRGILVSIFTEFLGSYWSHYIEFLSDRTIKYEDHNHLVWRVCLEQNDKSKSGSQRRSELQLKAHEALMTKVLAYAETQRRRASKAMDDLASAHRLVMSSIRYASLLQHAQIPRPIRVENRFEDFAVLWEPRDTIGGDLWWISHSGQRDPFNLCVIDCSGHGVPGAMLALLASTSLERIFSNDPQLSPSKGLLQLSLAMRRGLNQDQEPVSNEELQNDGCDAAFVQIDCDVGTLTYAGANIDLIWIPKGGELQRLHGNSVSLGYRGADPDQFTEQTLAFETGDRFLITTDGYVDQVSGSNQNGRRRGFGYQRLMQLLRQNRMKSLAENMQILQDSLTSWQGDGYRRDDITIFSAQLKR